MKPDFAVALSHYGGQSLAYARLASELEEEGIPYRSLRGCPYPEMMRAEQVRAFLESDRQTLVFVDGNVTISADGVRKLAEAARTAGVAFPDDEQMNTSWLHGLECCAVDRSVLESMMTVEKRRYGNAQIDMTWLSEKVSACPLASPWERDGAPIVKGEWLTDSEAFLHRAHRASRPEQRFRRVSVGASVARRKIVTSISNADRPVTSEPGSRFALCIPSFGSLDVDQTDRVRKLERVGMMVVRVHDCPWIDQARSWCAEIALEYERGVFFLDHDIIFHPNDVLRLCEQALERNAVVAGVYSMRTAGKNLIGAPDVAPGPITFFQGGSTIPAHYSGMGFTAIPREVLEETGSKLSGCWSEPFKRRLRPWFALDCSTNFYAGEDVSFCKRVHDLTIREVVTDGETEWKPVVGKDARGGDGVVIISGASEANVTYSGRRNCRIFLDTRVRLAHRGQYDYGIEDGGCVVPRCDSLQTLMTESRAEARKFLQSAMEIPIEARLDMIEGYSPAGGSRQEPSSNPDFEAI